MPVELLRRGLLDRRRALVAWSLGVSAYVLLIAAIFPSIKSSKELDNLVESYPDALKSLFGIGSGSLTSGPGFLDAELFSFMLPLFVLVLAIGSGARTLAGEEDAGRLELLLAYPVDRGRAVLVKAVAVAVEVALLCVVILVVLAVFDPLFGLDVASGKLTAAVGGLAVIGIMHGWLAVAVGAAVASRTLALGIPAALAAGGYLIGGLHDLAGWLDPFRFLSAFWWIGSSPLQNGLRGWGVLVVAVTALVALAAAAKLFERRDLRVP
jgi:ABC-2 type transport system permease protein